MMLIFPVQWLLDQLWESRHTQVWPSTATPWIGRRLVEVRFSHGSRSAAMRLLEDICYNLRRVWGALDPTTLQMDTLRSELYTAAGQHADAMRVHEDILQEIVSDSSPAAGDLSVDSAAQTTRLHLDLLKRAHQRLGGWNRDPALYDDLDSALRDQFRDEKICTDVLPMRKWSAKPPPGSSSSSSSSAHAAAGGGSNGDGGGLGVFVAPRRWEFLEVKEVRPHLNYLRKVSGSQRWESGSRAGREMKRCGSSGLFPYVETR